MIKEKSEIDQWKTLRNDLAKDFEFNDHWKKAIDLFGNRFKKKYFEPIEKLIDQDWLQGEGFTIVTIQCSLIETFATLRTGKIYLHSKKAGSPGYYYNRSKEIFTEFLKSASIFEDHFWSRDPLQHTVKMVDSPFNSSSFYDDVRCGLMHEARTKNKWIINAEPKSRLNIDQTKFIEEHNGDIKIYRTILHFQLKKYLEEYCVELTGNNLQLRKYFARKMDHIFEYSPDPNNFDWWNDF